MDYRRLLRAKNTAGDALYKAERAIDRRRHTFGSVPAAWLARHAELVKAYAEALREVAQHAADRLLALDAELDTLARKWVALRQVGG